MYKKYVIYGYKRKHYALALFSTANTPLHEATVIYEAKSKNTSGQRRCGDEARPRKSAHRRSSRLYWRRS